MNLSYNEYRKVKINQLLAKDYPIKVCQEIFRLAWLEGGRNGYSGVERCLNEFSRIANAYKESI